MPKNIGETSLGDIFELIKEKVNYLKGLIDDKADSSKLAKVATSNSYSDLDNKPTIPSSLPANGGNADTVDGYHIRIVSTDDGGKDGYITFVV